tara:strand:- start:598 stop:882 length:285 start_codon:yes stop_codon:yes gene_type:complete
LVFTDDEKLSYADLNRQVQVARFVSPGFTARAAWRPVIIWQQCYTMFRDWSPQYVGWRVGLYLTPFSTFISAKRYAKDSLPQLSLGMDSAKVLT